MMAVSDNLGGMLVFTVTFLGLFAILGGMMPEHFYVDFSEPSISIPDDEYWGAYNLNFYANSLSYTMNETGGWFQGIWYIYDFKLGDHELRFSYKKSDQESKYLYMEHRTGWPILVPHEMESWKNNNGMERTTEESGFHNMYGTTINEDIENNRLPYRVSCEHTTVTVFFAYNETLYSDVDEAWENKELHVLFCLGFDQLTTSMNAWDLITMILFFNIPDTHPIISAIIAIPIWVSIIYLAYRLILLALPFVG